MEDNIIDGRKLALLRQQKLEEVIKTLNKTPKVVSFLIGEDAPSVLYTNIKQKKAIEIGINFQPIHLASPLVEWEVVCSKIEELNQDESVDGIMVQLPLPEEFLKGKNDSELLELIDGEKDVDGLTTKGKFLSATARSVISILEDENISVEGKKVVVVGASNLVGKPVAESLRKMNANVEVCDTKTTNLKECTLQADILISATGVPGLITGDMVKDNVIVIDVGAEKVDGKVVGDVDFESVAHKASRITPVPGGVGPMTVISLMENVVEAVNIKS
ncbi:MAG: tetrahydrofolate dehydrogenase/cyclohydrolase catalytic domain-containing protein [Candidatus Daviesbacteria bacterium]|nr:tetrahydrofolate dehydrogenase/cyclohydrolase catalytic domain-containing protein [Candidatus Daviesbacteria bacterium]